MALTKVSSGLISADASLVDLNIDAGTLYIDATNNRVGVKNQTPTVALDVTGDLVVSASATLGTTSVGQLTFTSLTNTTTDISEGSKLFFTEQRVLDTAPSGSLGGTLGDVTVQYRTDGNYSGTPNQGSFYFDALNSRLKVYTGSEFIDTIPFTAGGGGGATTEANATFFKYQYTVTSETNNITGADIQEIPSGAYVIGKSYEISVPGTTDFTALGSADNISGTTFTATATGLVTAGDFVATEEYTIVSVDDGAGGATTDFTLIGAADNDIGTTFTATGVGAGTGFASQGSGTAHGVLGYSTSSSTDVVVFVNGVKQRESSIDGYQASTGTNIAFTYNLPVDSVVDVQVYELLKNDAYYTKAQTYTQTETNTQISTALSTYDDQTASDTRYVNITGDTMTGNLDVTGSVTASNSLVIKGGALPVSTTGLFTVSGLSTGKLTSSGASKASSITSYYDDTYIEIVAGVSAGYMSGISIGGRSYAGTGGDAITFSPRGTAALTLAGATGAATFTSNASADSFGFTQNSAAAGIQDAIFRSTTGRIEVRAGNVDYLLVIDGTNGVIVNDGGVDRDFRVESNNNANAFLVDAGNDQVRTDAVFVHDADGSNQPFYITRSGLTDQGLQVTVDDNNVILKSIQDETSGANFIFYSSNATTSDLKLLQLDYSAGTVFNEDGVNYQHVRMESDTDAHAFYLNAVNGYIGMGAGSAPPHPLSVGTSAGSGLNYWLGTANVIQSNSGIKVSRSTTNDATVGVGLNLSNTESTNTAMSPMITFSALSASGTYSTTYAGIWGRKISSGTDTNWNVGDIEFGNANSAGLRKRMSLNYLGGLVTFPDTSGHTVFNEDGVDADFRVESNGNENMLFVDAGNNIVKIGDSATTTGTSFTANTGRIDAPSGSASLNLGNRNNNTDLTNGSILSTISFFGYFSGTYGGGNDIASIQGVYGGDGTTRTGELRFRTINAGTEKIKLTLGPTEAVFNDESVNYDFRVESDAHTDKIFVDASANNAYFSGQAQAEGPFIIGTKTTSGGMSVLKALEVNEVGTGPTSFTIQIATGSIGEYFAQIRIVGVAPYSSTGYFSQLYELAGYGGTTNITTLTNTRSGAGTQLTFSNATQTASYTQLPVSSNTTTYRFTVIATFYSVSAATGAISIA